MSEICAIVNESDKESFDVAKKHKKDFVAGLKALCDEYGVTMESWYLFGPNDPSMKVNRYFVSEDKESNDVFWQIEIDERFEKEINGR